MIKKITLIAGIIFGAGSSFGQIVDGGFEAGAGAGTWTEASTNFGTVHCDAATCGTGGGTAFANNGNWYLWFGGATAVETGSAEQSVLFPSGTSASLDMYIMMAATGTMTAADRMEISVDGNILSTITALDSATYQGAYVFHTVDASAYADGSSHTVRLEGFQTTAVGFSGFLDDIILMVDGAPAVGLFEAKADVEMSVYPNPATDVINLDFGQVEGNTVVTIRNIDGAVMSEQSINDVMNKTFTFGTSDMANGVYLVEVRNSGNTTTKRFTVAK